MSITSCPICGRLVSDGAPCCPGCGLVINGAVLKRLNKAGTSAASSASSMPEDHKLRTTLLQAAAIALLGAVIVIIGVVACY